MSKFLSRFTAIVAVTLLTITVGCGPDTSTTVSAPPPEMTPEQKAELAKKQNEHYAAPSNADRMQTSN